MKHFVTIVSTLGLLLGSALRLPAQEQPSLLSFGEALERAFEQNPAIRALAYEERAAQQERRAAIGLRMPQIKVAGTYAYLGKEIRFDFNDMKAEAGQLLGQIGAQLPQELLPVIGQLTAPILGADWGLTLQNRSLGFVGGEVTLPIWMGGKINAANRAARISEQSVRAGSRQVRNALVSELAERYFGLALAEQVVAVRQQVVDGVKQHLADAEAMERNGMLARSQRLYVAFKVEEAERELENARLQLETLRSALANTLGEEAPVTAMPATAMFVLRRPEPLAYYRDAALAQNPLLDQVGYKRELAHEQVRALRAEFLPQVVAVGGASFYNYQVTDLLPRWAVGVGVSLKIFNGLHREYTYSAARQTEKRVEQLQQKAEADVTVLVEKLYNELNHYANRLASLEASLEFACEYQRSQKAAFREGMASSAELIDAELNLSKVRTERLQAAYAYDLALARLLEAAGLSDEFAACACRPDAEPVRFE